MNAKDKLRAMDTGTLLKMRRQWADALNKRKADPDARAAWQRNLDAAEVVLKERGVQP